MLVQFHDMPRETITSRGSGSPARLEATGRRLKSGGEAVATIEFAALGLLKVKRYTH